MPYRYALLSTIIISEFGQASLPSSQYNNYHTECGQTQYALLSLIITINSIRLSMPYSVW